MFIYTINFEVVNSLSFKVCKRPEDLKENEFHRFSFLVSIAYQPSWVICFKSSLEEDNIQHRVVEYKRIDTFLTGICQKMTVIELCRNSFR